MTDLTTTPTASRLASAAALGALTLLALAVPAPALADPGSDSGSGVDAGAARNLVEAPTVDIRRLLNEVEADATGAARPSTPAPASTLATDGGWLDTALLALGALSGAAVAGGVVRVTVRRRHVASPA